MTLTLLFDLDDTLLNTNVDVFIPAYFQAISKHLESYAPSKKIVSALIDGMRIMSGSEDPTRTLEQVFDSDFYPKIGAAKEEMAPALDDFYDEIFPTLQYLTARRPDTVPFMEWAFSQGYRIAIATDPLLPRKATRHRLRWAGLDPDRFEVISTYEHFHFSKTHPAYFAEILGRMGWQDGPVLMIGNDVERDLLTARRLGLGTFYVNGDQASGPSGEANGRGNLYDLRAWLESIDPNTLLPDFKSIDSILGTMLATPAVLSGLSGTLSASSWTFEPAPDDWALTELVCHLRDTEREIHHLQIKLLIDQRDPFIPRPDSGIWANQRRYINEDGPHALREFAEARMQTLGMLKSLESDAWSRKARHAIFGPTHFQEVIGFMAEHDRLHIHQAWKILHRNG